MAGTDLQAYNRSLPAMVEIDEQDDELEIDLIELLYRLLEKAKWIALIAILCAAVTAVYVTFFAKPVYSATSKLYVLNSSDSVINMSDLQIGQSLASDYVQVFSNWHVHRMVMDRLGLDMPYENIQRMVSCHNPSGTRLLFITTQSNDPLEAKKMADTYADVACEFITVTMRTDTPSIFEEALLPEKPTSPHKFRDTVLGFLVGFVLACGVFVVQFIVDDRVRSADMIEKRLNLAVLGMMPEQAQNEDTKAKRLPKAKKAKKSKGGARK